MALGIPLPGEAGEGLLQGLNTGSTMFSRIMQPILEREKQKQLEQHFQQQLAMQQKQQARAGQFDALKRMMMEQQLQGMRNANDPMYKINQFQNIAKMLGAGNMVPQEARPQKIAGEGLGMYSPEGLEQAQTAPSQSTGDAQGMNLDVLRNNPLLRGFFKQQFGYDPIEKEQAYHGAARDAYDLERLRKEVGEDSPVYQNAIQTYKASQQAKEDLSGLRGRTLGGLKPGERWIKNDKTGEIEGKEIPLTATERTEHKGRGFFNYVFPYISNGLSPISGQGSIRKFEQASREYKTNPAAQQLIDDWLLGKKLLTAGVVKESSTLGSGKQKSTYQQLRESLNSSDIPEKIGSIIKQFNLPPEAMQRADQRFQQILNEATEAGESNVPAFQKHLFNPKQHPSAEKESSDMNRMVKIIDPDGKIFETPAYNAKNLPAGWKHA
jgi:hypothetical protein